MKTYWWQIGGAAVLILAAVITAKVFWPTQRPNSRIGLRGQPELQEAQPKPGVEGLYQTALLRKDAGDSERENCRIVVDCCRQILSEYPNSPQAEKARELLREMRQRYECFLTLM